VSWGVAPQQLPLAPRPQPDEILSSWLMRVAAANAVSLDELLNALLIHYPTVLQGCGLLDWKLPSHTLAALARFCRVPVGILRGLDLRARLLDPQPLLLRFPANGASSSPPYNTYDRRHELRVRYGHCGPCLSAQAVPHIRWDWCLAALIRCHVHRVPLQDGCHHCGEVDPLPFAAAREPGPPLCWSCGVVLAPPARPQEVASAPELEEAIADAYRDVLRGVAPRPALLGKAMSGEFRRFVHDMLEMLGRCIAQQPEYPSLGAIQRSDLMAIVGDLIRTAAPSSNPGQRRRRYTRALVLWGTLLKLMGPSQGEELGARTRHWPPALRRRWESALLRRGRRRWPYPPFSAAAGNMNAKAKLRAFVAAYGLRQTQDRPRQSGG
jgi:hypothetical protein